MPYNLTRWASYPRTEAPLDALNSFVNLIKDSPETVFSGRTARNLLEARSISSNDPHLQTSTVEEPAVQEDKAIRGQAALLAEKIKNLHFKVFTQRSASEPRVSMSTSRSSGQSFQTADSHNETAAGCSVQTIGRDIEKISTDKPKANELENVGSVDIIKPVPVTRLSSVVPIHGAEAPTTTILGNKHPPESPLDIIFDDKLEKAPPPVPPKPENYIPVARESLEGNKPQTSIQSNDAQTNFYKHGPPTMLIFKVIKTRTNLETRKCEYYLAYKWSGDHPSFPNCPETEEIFTFDDLCTHKAVIARLRQWHSTHICVSKDARVEEVKYRLSNAEYNEINHYPWPKHDLDGWRRCLIWGSFGLKPYEG